LRRQRQGRVNWRQSSALVATLLGACVLVGHAAYGVDASRAGPRTVKAFMTLYGYADNSPPGRAIAHPCVHHVAGGQGTYGNPMTFATDVREIGWCQRIYVPYMKRYFIHEDECSECDHDWTTLHRYRFDMWAGGSASSVSNPMKSALLACEAALTRDDYPRDPGNPRILVNPQRGLPVTTAPIFSAAGHCWQADKDPA